MSVPGEKPMHAWGEPANSTQKVIEGDSATAATIFSKTFIVLANERKQVLTVSAHEHSRLSGSVGLRAESTLWSFYPKQTVGWRHPVMSEL